MILDYLFTFGQAAAALFLLYGAWLALVPPRKPRVALDDELLLLRHLQSE